jgi:hypothetical protein
MPSTLTQLDIYNLAMDHLSEVALSATTEDNVYARWMNRNYANLRDSMLRMHPWNFATELTVLTASATTPTFKWLYQYTLPASHLRVIPPTYLGQRGGQPVPFQIRQNLLMCNIGPSMYVETINRVTNEGDFDPLFGDTLGLFMAMRMSHRFTAKVTYRDRLDKDFKEAMASAAYIDFLEGTPEPAEQQDIILVRGEYTGDNSW